MCPSNFTGRGRGLGVNSVTRRKGIGEGRKGGIDCVLVVHD